MPRKQPKSEATNQAEDQEILPTLDDIYEVADCLVLRDVVFLKLNAERFESPDAAPETVQRNYRLLVRETPGVLQARVDSIFSSPEATFQLNALAIYEKSEEFFVSQSVQQEFLERVGIFTIWPYLRAQLHSLCDGLSVERIDLPLIRQGQITMQASGPSPVA